MTEDEERRAIATLLTAATNIQARTGDDTPLNAVISKMTQEQRKEWIAACETCLARLNAVKSTLKAAGPNGLSGHDLYANTRTYFTDFDDFAALIKSMVKRGEVKKPWFKSHYTITAPK
jgi:hypothetical protein